MPLQWMHDSTICALLREWVNHIWSCCKNAAAHWFLCSIDQTSDAIPFFLLDGHGGCFEESFLDYINNDLHRWKVCIGVPYETNLWQVGDSMQQNGSLKMLLKKVKKWIVEKNQMDQCHVTHVKGMVWIIWKSWAKQESNSWEWVAAIELYVVGSSRSEETGRQEWSSSGIWVTIFDKGCTYGSQWLEYWRQNFWEALGKINEVKELTKMHALWLLGKKPIMPQESLLEHFLQQVTMS